MTDKVLVKEYAAVRDQQLNQLAQQTLSETEFDRYCRSKKVWFYTDFRKFEYEDTSVCD